MMLEAIQVTEHLHWRETDMSKKSVLGKPVSVSLLCVERWSPSSRSNTNGAGFLQTEEDQSPNYSLSRCPNNHICTFSHSEVKPLVLFRAGPLDFTHLTCFSSSHRQGILSILGSPIGLSPRPTSRPSRDVIKLPPLAKSQQNGKIFPKKQCILSAIKPSNIEREKIKFFKSGFTYDPQFLYSNPAPPQILEKNSKASDCFLIQAVRIMEAALDKYGSYEQFEQATGGHLLTKTEVWTYVKKYMEKEGCVGEIVVHLSDDLLSRASMTVVNGRPTLTINMSTAREQWLEGMLRHEIGTHYFRNINNSQQPWGNSSGRRKLGLRPYNPTEEGLASIHSVLFRRDPTLWRAALLYYTVHQAAQTSFTHLFHNLRRFMRDPGTRWDYCVRAKRGQTDTSQPGCFNKDQVYLDGIMKLLRNREKIDFQLLTALGKVSYEDVERLKGLAVMEHVRIPHFLQDQARYTQELQRIMEVNQLGDEELHALI